MKRYTVLTYIINNYEKVHEIQSKDPEAEYILVTDDKELTSKTWTIIYDEDLKLLSPFDKCYAIRFNCFKYSHTNICVRIDGSIEVKNSLKPIIDAFEDGKYDACLMPHPVRDNFIEEYNTWVETREYDNLQAKRCIDSMSKKGYDFNYKGLFQCCFSIQRRGELTDSIDRLTLEYLKELGSNGMIERIDQIPFSFVMNTQFNHIKVLPVSEQIVRSHYLQWYLHNSMTPNNSAFYNLGTDDIKYMFNEPVKCMYATAPMVENTVICTKSNGEECHNLQEKSIAVHVHVFYADLVGEIVRYLNNIPQKFDLYVSVPKCVAVDPQALKEELCTIHNIGQIYIHTTPNVGRDIAPMLCEFGKELQKYNFIAHFHTKKTKEDPTLADWRQHIFSHLLGSQEIIAHILKSLDNNIGMIAPPDYSSCWDTSGWSSNLEVAQNVVNKSSLNINLEKEYPAVSFPQGTMFWARTDFLKEFFTLPITYKDFPKEPIKRDGTIAHALERLFFIWGRDTNLKVQKVFLFQEEMNCWTHMKTMMINRQQELFDIIASYDKGNSNHDKDSKAKKHLKAIRSLIYALSIAVVVIIIMGTILIVK